MYAPNVAPRKSVKEMIEYDRVLFELSDKRFVRPLQVEVAGRAHMGTRSILFGEFEPYCSLFPS